FENGLLEYPQYTRPEDFKGVKVPEVLLSGHHANIELWRLAMSLLRTHEHRPDMLEGFKLEKLRRRALLKYVRDNELFSEEEREIIGKILDA
ncbi:MAG: hypothetical protein J6S72_07355, partial [Lachnospiraceae bacterium]|nr:hypothetical protein [Lachnospiraceae bacterium]